MNSAIEQINLLDAINVLGKISIVLAIAFALQGFVRFSSADRRALIVKISLIYLCLAPFLIIKDWGLSHQIQLQAPFILSAISDRAMDIPALPQLAYQASENPNTETSFSAVGWLLAIYALIASLLLLQRLYSLYRLVRSQDKLPHSMGAEFRLERHYLWTDRLHQLSAQFGISSPVQLSISDSISSPISWGIWRHTIVIDINSFQNQSPDDILRHELAHIVNRDWPSMIAMRMVCALYWFHPLVWLLQRQFLYQMECAADNTVLRMGSRASDYAQTLIDVSRAAESRKHMAMQIASEGQSLYQRIVNILNPEQVRTPVTRRDWWIGIALTGLILFCSASFSIVGEQVQWPRQLFENSLAHKAAPNRVASEVIHQLEALNDTDFHALASAMRSRNFEDRHAKKPGSFKQRQAIPILILALHDEEPVIRQLALWGLSEMRFYETLPVIAILLKDQDALVRAEAVGAIGDFGEKEWASKILPLLSDSSPVVRERVAHALGDLNDPRTLRALEEALHDQRNHAHPRVMNELRWALQEIQH
ncbi:M56 family metallopeptidase [Undibacterium cyanobacteriorum]|uniref:M56 family metallopeptidase n=1 Tax=Undibacterium cyanobacteriorum TaxID=3073561 RepID=A0ABY9RGI0_9BURK|nr:M56 family metallopeptidase [Undibacterium sp. 20NA77.5]WMW80056.1 M56 family metallopeptidase [Undibacterium sp. 20NA77.5]